MVLWALQAAYAWSKAQTTSQPPVRIHGEEAEKIFRLHCSDTIDSIMIKFGKYIVLECYGALFNQYFEFAVEDAKVGPR